MDKSKIENFKNKLQKELELLTSELQTVAKINPNNPGDWEPKAVDGDYGQADRNEVADEIGNFETNVAISKDLEIRFNEVKNALKRIEDGGYGICEIGGESIEEERLEANPAATTCKAHLNEKK